MREQPHLGLAMTRLVFGDKNFEELLLAELNTNISSE